MRERSYWHHMCTRWTGWCERRRIDLSGCFDREAGSDERCNRVTKKGDMVELTAYSSVDITIHVEAVLDRVLQTAKEVGSVSESKCWGMF